MHREDNTMLFRRKDRDSKRKAHCCSWEEMNCTFLFVKKHIVLKI